MNGASVATGRPTLGGLRALGGGGASAGIAIPDALPFVWYDGRNLDGNLNSSMVNNGNTTARRNLGTGGPIWDQGAGLNVGLTAIVPPICHIPGAAGKCAGAPAINGTGTQYATTWGVKYSSGLGISPKVNGPLTIVSVFRVTDLAATYYLYTGFAAGAECELVLNLGGAGLIQLNNGGGFVSTAQNVVAGNWNLSIAIINGANSRHRLNGVQSALLNTNAVGYTGVSSLGPQNGSAFIMKGDEILHMRWPGLPDPTDIENLISNVWGFGAFPQ